MAELEAEAEKNLQKEKEEKKDMLIKISSKDGITRLKKK